MPASEKQFKRDCGWLATLVDPNKALGYGESVDRKLSSPAHIRVEREDASGPITIKLYRPGYTPASIDSLGIGPELTYELPVQLAADLVRAIVDALAAGATE